MQYCTVVNQVITTTDNVNASHGHGVELKQPNAEECTHSDPSHAKLKDSAD